MRQLLACHVEVSRLHELNEEPEIDRGVVNEQLIMVRDAISLAVEALTQKLGGKMQTAFNLLKNDTQWPQDIDELRRLAMRLAAGLQRPPTKAELRKHYNSKYKPPAAALKEKDFSLLLKHAGLSWLKKSA